MHLPGFFRLGWIVQLIVGVALFSVSFLIENLVLKSFFAAPLIALTLAAALELGKAAAIVWHRYLSLSTGGGYPWATRIFSTLFRFGLLGLSVVCSLLYFGVQLDRPNLQAVRTAELAAVDRDLQERLGRLDAEQANRTTYDTDDRVNDPLVVALMRMSADVIHHQITPPQFVFIFSLFISLLMEIGILLAFDTVTLILIPALEARHQEQMMNEALQAEITGETKRHRAAMERVRKGAERAFEQATVKAQRAA